MSLGAFAVVFLLCGGFLFVAAVLVGAVAWFGYRAGFYRRTLSDSERSAAAQAVYDFMVQTRMLEQPVPPEPPRKPWEPYEPPAPPMPGMANDPVSYHDLPPELRERQ